MLYKQNGDIVLASGSPRRKQMLSEVELRYVIDVSNIDETQQQGELPEDLVRRLAVEKATQVSCRHPGAWIIGADTDVSVDGKILGKPKDANDAMSMLRLIQGRKHEVWGGLAIINLQKRVEHVETHRSLVEIVALDESTIANYVSTGEPMDKAGSYAVQGLGGQFIKSIEGSYTNVVGLNLSALISALRRYGVLE